MRGREHEAVLAIPPVVRPAIVRVQPPTIVVAIRTEEVRVAIRVVLYEIPSIPPPIE